MSLSDRMTDRDKRNLFAAVRIMRTHGYGSREAMLRDYDDDADYTDIDGIGPARGRVLRRVVRHATPPEFLALTGMTYMEQEG